MRGDRPGMRGFPCAAGSLIVGQRRSRPPVPSQGSATLVRPSLVSYRVELFGPMRLQPHSLRGR